RNQSARCARRLSSYCKQQRICSRLPRAERLRRGTARETGGGRPTSARNSKCGFSPSTFSETRPENLRKRCQESSGGIRQNSCTTSHQVGKAKRAWDGGAQGRPSCEKIRAPSATNRRASARAEPARRPVSGLRAVRVRPCAV